MSKDNYKPKDFLGQEFVLSECYKCKKQYYHMELDKISNICPGCDNGKETDEVDI